MLTPFERLVAWRYLRAKRGESFISVIVTFSLVGIALGVATLIIVTSVMNGVKEEMLRHFVGLSGHVHVYGQGRPLENYQQLIERLRKVEGVANATPVIDGQVMVTANGQARGVQVKAFFDNKPSSQAYVQDKIVAGDWNNFAAGNGLLVGSRLADSLRLAANAPITLISPNGRQTVVGMVPRMKAYPAVGAFTFGMQSIDNSLVLMPFDAAQSFFKLADNGRDAVTAIEINAIELDKAEDVAAAIRSAIGPDYLVLDWKDTNAAIFEALNVQRTVMFLILTLIILVAAFNIIASLIMLVKDKQRDIAVLRSMGASRASIQRIFISIGTLIGLVGTGIGVSLGLLVALNLDDMRRWFEATTGRKLLGEQLYFLNSLPAEVDGFEVAMVVVMALGLSFLATLYPARRASALNPAEALRYE